MSRHVGRPSLAAAGFQPYLPAPTRLRKQRRQIAFSAAEPTEIHPVMKGGLNNPAGPSFTDAIADKLRPASWRKRCLSPIFLQRASVPSGLIFRNRSLTVAAQY